MRGFFRISEASAVGFHALALLARKKDLRIKGFKIAATLKVSHAYLDKIFQALEKHGLVRAIRGPAGGYLLAKDSRRITLLEIYEALEGRGEMADCLFENMVCTGRKCLLGGLVETVNREARSYLARTKLSEVKEVYLPQKMKRHGQSEM